MKKKSEKNIFDRTGFLWQAWVHNCTNITVNESRKFSINNVYDIDKCDTAGQLPEGGPTHIEKPGMCQHGKDTFFQWHRAELYFYEQALRNADPLGIEGPSTKDVTIPYWNFTQKPTGDRFPKAFENVNSTLYVKNREKGTLPVDGPYLSPYLLAYILYRYDWPQFGGYPTVDRRGNYGAFEAQFHNPMHDKYIVGYLEDPSTAGLDPLFYVFHAYIDYIFEKWIETHGSENITGGRGFSRGEQSDKLPKPVGFSEGSGAKREPDNYTKNMGRGEIYYDTVKQGYVYNSNSRKEFITEEELDDFIRNQPPFGESKESLYSRFIRFGLHKPSKSIKDLFSYSVNFIVSEPDYPTVLLDVVRRSSEADYDFQVDVYLSPANVDIEVSSEAFRRRYLVVDASYWGVQVHHQHDEDEHQKSSLTITIDISDTARSILSGKNRDNDWMLTIAISSDSCSGNCQFRNPDIRFEK